MRHGFPSFRVRRDGEFGQWRSRWSEAWAEGRTTSAVRRGCARCTVRSRRAAVRWGRRAFDSQVYLLTLADRAVLAYGESHLQGQVEKQQSLVVPILNAYHQLQGEALSQAASIEMIRQLRKGIP